MKFKFGDKVTYRVNRKHCRKNLKAVFHSYYGKPWEKCCSIIVSNKSREPCITIDCCIQDLKRGWKS